MSRYIFQAWNVIALRYFNPVGAHPSGFIGEDPAGGFSNIVPIIGEVLTGRKKAITVFGSDYDTPDGTGNIFFLFQKKIGKKIIKNLKIFFCLERPLKINLIKNKTHAFMAKKTTKNNKRDSIYSSYE